MTAVEQLYDDLHKYVRRLIMIERNRAIISKEQALDLERQQHQRTWDAAIEAYISRGVKERAMIDFDDYEIK